MKEIIRIGTRGSKLALYQAYRVKEALEQKYQDKSFEIVIIKTKGDKILDTPLSKIGDKGLFTKELEVAMLNNEIDMAVHSLKDLPTTFPEGTKLGAVLQRANPKDALVSRDNRKISELTSNDTIATSSLRRKAQLLKLNKDLKIVEIRGNVNTRIRKMQEGYCDAMIMASAGLQRLEMDEHISEIIDPDMMIPACGQGAIAIEIRNNDPFIESLIAEINHEETMITTSAERAFLNTLEGGCQIPVGSYSEIIENQIKITGFVSSIDGSNFLKDTISGPVKDAKQIAIQLAQKLSNNGGKQILDSIRNENLPVGSNEKPLEGKVIISTRAIDESDNLPRLLTNAGSRVISLPMIRIEPATLGPGEIDTLKKLENYHWIIFTSKNGVSCFFKQLLDLKGDTTLPKELKIATIGKKTTAELDYYGYSPTFSGTKNTSEDLLNQMFEKYSLSKLNFLLPLGNLADNYLEGKLSKSNSVKRINVYSTLKPTSVDESLINKISQNEYDLIVFTSPSTFNNFCNYYKGNNLKNLNIASIGTTTTSAIEKAGISPQLTATSSNTEGLCEAIINYYKSKK